MVVYEYLPWFNLFIILVIIGLVIAIYVIYYQKVGQLEREGIAWNVIQGAASTTDTFTIGSYTMYIANTADMTVTLNSTNSSVGIGQQFAISNQTTGTVTVVAGSGITINNNVVVEAKTMALYVATASTNTYTRVQ